MLLQYCGGLFHLERGNSEVLLDMLGKPIISNDSMSRHLSIVSSPVVVPSSFWIDFSSVR